MRNLYLRNLANSMIQQLHIEIEMSASVTVQGLYKHFGHAIKSKLLVMKPETRGKIADLGVGYGLKEYPDRISLYEVHCQPYLGKYQSGRDLVMEIACTAIVAMIYEILSERATSALVHDQDYAPFQS